MARDIAQSGINITNHANNLSIRRDVGDKDTQDNAGHGQEAATVNGNNGDNKNIEPNMGQDMVEQSQDMLAPVGRATLANIGNGENMPAGTIKVEETVEEDDGGMGFLLNQIVRPKKTVQPKKTTYKSMFMEGEIYTDDEEGAPPAKRTRRLQNTIDSLDIRGKSYLNALRTFFSVFGIPFLGQAYARRRNPDLVVIFARFFCDTNFTSSIAVRDAVDLRYRYYQYNALRKLTAGAVDHRAVALELAENAVAAGQQQEEVLEEVAKEGREMALSDGFEAYGVVIEVKFDLEDPPTM
ncbi:hypothetical protein LTR66_005435 [Elasticomyces elasticus]|nr:hypothetical protein LTR28_007166 [Elasticomyces elasticus]KAK4994573.1 hypothetical protein LTR66_005435 [Elasticomyces elasticus]